MFPQAGFEDRPLWFNGVQIRRVRGQIFQVTAFGFDKSLGGSGLMEGRIVHQDGLPRTQLRQQRLLQPCIEHPRITIALKAHGGHEL